MHASSPAHLRTGALDVRDAEAWERLMGDIAAQWPQLDTVMNVAGVLRPEYVGQTSTASIHLLGYLDFHIQLLKEDCLGLLYISLAYIPFLRNLMELSAPSTIVTHIVSKCSKYLRKFNVYFYIL